MKHTKNVLWLLAAIITIGIAAVACDNGTNPAADPCASEHAFPAWTAPTCTTEGNSVRACTREGCTATDTRAAGFAKLDHDWEYDPGAIAPTCLTTGLGHRHCKNCDADEAGTTPYAALGHEGTIAPFAATCTTAGNSALSGNCVRFAQCGHVVIGTVIPAGHKWIVTTPPNFVTETDGEAKCSACSTNQVYKFYKIGNTGPAGGIIFYVAPSGFTVQGYSGATGSFAEYTAYYLEAAPANESGTSRWQAASGNTQIEGVTTILGYPPQATQVAASIGVGRKDTQTIVNSAAFAALTDTAAQRCASKTLNGFSDWFLPSLGELSQMYIQRSHVGITTGFFWSSTQYTDSNAWVQSFGSGGVEIETIKSNVYPVRAVRAF